MCPIKDDNTECNIPDHIENDIKIDSWYRIEVIGLRFSKDLSDHLCGMTELCVHLDNEFRIDDLFYFCFCVKFVVTDFVKLN